MYSKKDEHWAKTKSLTFTTLVIWAIVSFVIHWFGEGLNSVPSGGLLHGGHGLTDSLCCIGVLVFQPSEPNG